MNINTLTSLTEFVEETNKYCTPRIQEYSTAKEAIDGCQASGDCHMIYDVQGKGTTFLTCSNIADSSPKRDSYSGSIIYTVGKLMSVLKYNSGNFVIF